jgi:hypothetical protein
LPTGNNANDYQVKVSLIVLEYDRGNPRAEVLLTDLWDWDAIEKAILDERRKL